MHLSRSLLGLPAAACLIIVTGCSSTDSGPDASGTASDGSASAAASSAGASATATTGQKVPGSTLAARMAAAMQQAKTFQVQTSSTTGNVGNLSTTAKTQYVGGKVNSQGSANFGGLKFEMISIGNGSTMYLKGPALNLSSWTKVDRASSNPVIRQVAAQMGTLRSQFDPTSQLAVLGKAGSFTAAGQETVDGVSTTKYTGTIPAAAIPKVSGMSLGDMPMTVYLDARNRPIKQVSTATAGSTKVESTVTYSNYGAPYVVKAPA